MRKAFVIKGRSARAITGMSEKELMDLEDALEGRASKGYRGRRRKKKPSQEGTREG